MAAASSPNAARARRAPSTKGGAKVAPAEQSKRTRLSVVSARRLAERAQRRRARTIALLAFSFVVVGLLAIVAGQAMVASQQVRLDNLTTQLSSATATNANLELQRAQLSAPATVLRIAQHQLHMVSPTAVTYLNPVNPGETVAQAAAAR